MDCSCHGIPSYWQKDKRCDAGGWWECSVKRAAHNRTRTTDPARRERTNAQKRDRYDANPVYRIGKRLHDDARNRADTLKRRRESLGNHF